MEKNISVCIPVYEMKGLGRDYLKHSLDILNEQVYRDFEVIVSDHSTYFAQQAMQNLCKKYPFVKYFHNKEYVGSSSANINNAISKATGKIIKVLFQDDFLFNDFALQNIANAFTKGWLVTACEHYRDGMYYRPFYPEYNKDILKGENTISSPSVLAFENKEPLEFDDNLNWMMDCDYYYRLHERYGDPTILNIITVANRTHENQQSNIISQEDKDREFDYIKEKYGK